MIQSKLRLISGFCLAGCLGFAFFIHAAPPAGYNLQWSDEFNNNALNTSFWTCETGWRRSAYNTSAAVSVANGCLVITTYTQGGTNFTGYLNSQNKVMDRYGYYEASIEYSNAPGQWSAFWLNSPWINNTNTSPTNGAEIDIFEHRCVDSSGNNWVNGGDNALHWDGYGSQEQSAEWSSQNIGVGTGFHTYGLLWTTNNYTFYVDGKVTWTTKQYLVSSALQYIHLTSEIESNSWAGTVPPGGYPGKANSKVQMLVDYVRYYAESPTIVQDLPAQVYVPAGQTYNYTVGVNGPGPYSYRWFSAFQLLGQISSNYVAPTSVAGISHNYYCVITNMFGATTSTVSSLTFISTPSLTNSCVSNNLTLNWPSDAAGWILQAQTNNASTGIGTNWADVTGSTAKNSLLIPVNPTNNSVFYRLVY